VLLPKIKKIPKNTNGRLAIPAPAGLLVAVAVTFPQRPGPGPGLSVKDQDKDKDSLRTVIAVSYVQPLPGHASSHGHITTSAIEASVLQAPACGTVYHRTSDET